MVVPLGTNETVQHVSLKHGCCRWEASVLFDEPGLKMR